MKLQFEIKNKGGAKRSLFCVAALAVVVTGVTVGYHLNPNAYHSATAELAASTAPKLQIPEVAQRITPPQPSAASAAVPNQDPATPLTRFKKPITIGPISSNPDDINCVTAEDNSPKSVTQMAAGAKPYSLAPEPVKVAPVAPPPVARVEPKPVAEAQTKAPPAQPSKGASTEKFSVIGATEKNVTIDIGGVIRTVSMNEALPNGAIFLGYDGKQIKTNLGVYLIN